MSGQLSVVIATRDRPELLRETVRSVSAQEGVGRIEIIVVHDQSDIDETVADVAPEADVRVIANTGTPGLAGARNTGIAAASTTYVAFCDDDDVWLPGKAARQIAELERRPDAELVATGIVVEYEAEHHRRFLRADTVTFADLLRDRLPELHPSTFLFRTEALRAAGMVSTEVPGGFGEDYELLLRMARRAPIANIPQPLVLVRWLGTSFFFQRWATMAAGLGHILDTYPQFRTDARGYARIRGQIAFADAAGRQRGRALRGVMDAARANPLEPRSVLAVLVAMRILRPEFIMRTLHRFGRGI